MHTFFILIIYALTTISLHAMETVQDKTNLTVFAIPDLNGLGSEDWYVKNLLGSNVEIVKVPTPDTPVCDLGQYFCISYLKKAIAEKQDCNPIFHATRQGTATILNYLADKSSILPKCVILEAALSSANSTIVHTLKGPCYEHKPYLQTAARLPLAYYWLPYCVKARLPFYWPGGKQAIKSVDKISTNIPIIIIHSLGDEQISYQDSCALYYRLRSLGNDNVYFISKEGRRHLQIIDNTNDRAIIHAILHKHKIIESEESAISSIDLSEFQLDHRPYKPYYDNLIFKEDNHELIADAAMIGISFGLLKFFGVSDILERILTI